MAKTKALITAQLICVFVFAYANCWLSHAQAQNFIFLDKYWPANTYTDDFPSGTIGKQYDHVTCINFQSLSTFISFFIMLINLVITL